MKTQIEKLSLTHLVQLKEQLVLSTPTLLPKIKEALNLKNEEDAHLGLLEVLKFLTLISKYKKKLTPSLNVDLAWHEFVLHTRKYGVFCLENFGEFIHHTPGGNEEENEQRFKQTLALYKVEFGALVEPWWPTCGVQASACGSCQGEEI